MRLVPVPLLVALALLSCGGDDPIGPQTNTCTGTCIVVQNQSVSLDVTVVQFSNCGITDWGPNRLDGGRLQPGGSRGWNVTAGCWDMQALARSGNTTYSSASFGVDIVSGQSYILVFSPP